ncbi:MAG: dTDP-4-amino-4,6-dideoxygalactose transaminase [Bacteroidetes bacterium]|jgi:dTDP-4-amino-4,6-dideoxygalactose transaminase|nr:dTDP-4-amino-4,6-dideoxygalactose transaminase [Bacteroidota bacterium]
MTIPFNKPHLTGKEIDYIREAFLAGKLSGDGEFTKRCHKLITEKYGFRKALLTTSCTDALEACAILLNIQPGDEVIAPSYTFVSTVNAFVLRGAKIVFADSDSLTGNIDATKIEALITSRTKAIVPVHYAGVACDMDAIMQIAEKHNLFVVEDAAQAIDSYYKGKPLGSIGHLAAFSFHDTKNIISGEGGMLVVNDERFVKRAEIIREKGTNRSAFFRGEVDKYGWVDVGSSFLPSEIIAAVLLAQLEQTEKIQNKRKQLWEQYFELLKPLEQKGFLKLPHIPEYATNNAHMFYIVLSDLNTRSGLIAHLKSKDIHAVFHYISLHKSVYYEKLHDGRDLPVADELTNTLLRLPMYYDLTKEQIELICKSISEFFEK